MNTLAFLSSLALFTLPVSAADAPAGGPAKPETAAPGAASSPEWRQQVSDAAGRQAALVVKTSSLRAAGIDPADLRVAVIRSSMGDSLKNMPQAQKTDFQKIQQHYGKAFDHYKKLNSARQSMIDKQLMEIHAQLPGVTVLENGMHYEIRKSDKPEENFPLAEINWAVIGTTTATIVETEARPHYFPWFKEVPETIPDGTEWIFYVPVKLVGSNQATGQYVRVAFSKRDVPESQDSDSEEDTAEHPDGFDPDIEDEE